MNKRYLVILLGLLAGIFSAVFPGTTIMLSMIAACGILIWRYLPQEDRKFLLMLFIAGISARFILLSLGYLFSVYTGGNGELVPDSRLYFLKSLAIVRGWRGQVNLIELIKIQEEVGKNSYLYLLSLFYLITGYNPAIVNPPSPFSEKLINCLIGTLTSLPIFYLAKDIFARRVARISSLLVVFYPSLILWSMTNNRDTINIFMVAVALFSLNRFIKERSKRYLIVFMISLSGLFSIRIYVFYTMLITGCFLVAAMVFAKIKRKMLVLLVIFILLAVFLNVPYSKDFKDKFFNLDRIAQGICLSNINIVMQGGSAYRIYDADTIVGGKADIFKLFKGFLTGSFYFMLVPFPWMASSLLHLLSYPQVLIWYFLIPFTFIGIIFGVRHKFKMSRSLLIYAFLTTWGFGMLEGNVGSAMRHRDLVLPVYFIYAAAGIVLIFNRKELFDEKE